MQIRILADFLPKILAACINQLTDWQGATTEDDYPEGCVSNTIQVRDYSTYIPGPSLVLQE